MNETENSEFVCGVEAFVQEYLIERGADFNETNWQDYDFITSGVIDSFEILNFLLVLRDKYGTQVEAADFADKDYRFLGRLVEHVVENADNAIV